MNIYILKNKYLNALFVFMLGSAIIHMVLLFLRALVSGDWHVLNYIHIIDVDWFVPGLPAGFGGDIASWALAGCLYAAILKFNKP